MADVTFASTGSAELMREFWLLFLELPIVWKLVLTSPLWLTIAIRLNRSHSRFARAMIKVPVLLAIAALCFSAVFYALITGDAPFIGAVMAGALGGMCLLLIFEGRWDE